MYEKKPVKPHELIITFFVVDNSICVLFLFLFLNSIVGVGDLNPECLRWEYKAVPVGLQGSWHE